jgi:hypothetical protein
MLTGVGGVFAGSGALFGTSAFSTVRAERTVSVETAGDASALLTLASHEGPNGAYANGETTGAIRINLDGTGIDNADGLSQNATTIVDNVVDITNSGTQDVTALTFTIDVTGTSNDSAHEAALAITTTGATINEGSDNGQDLLGPSTAPAVTDNVLGPGETAPFGIKIDLLNHGVDGDFESSADVTLSITAATTDSGSENEGSEGENPTSPQPSGDDFEITQQRGKVFEQEGFNDVEPETQNVRSAKIRYTGTQRIAHTDLAVRVTDADLGDSYPGYDVYDPDDPGYAVYASDPFAADVAPGNTRRVVVFGSVYTSAEDSPSGDPSFFHNKSTLKNPLDGNQAHRADKLQPGDIIKLVWRPETSNTVIAKETIQ